MRFIVDKTKPIRNATLVYLEKDYAFSVEPRPANCTYAVSVNELELMIDEEDLIVAFVAGYCPHPGWLPAILSPPHPVRAALRVESDSPLVPGVTVALTSRESRWSVLVDTKKGWICLGEPEQESSAVEFAAGCIAVLQGWKLTALWLHPKELPAGLKNVPPA